MVDCRYKWGDLQGSCNQAGDSQTRKPVCPTAPSPTPDYSTGNPCAPLQPLNGGLACPPEEILTCGIKPCVFEWDDWSVCNKATGKQSRSIKSGFTLPEGGGDVCPPPQERNCKVDCESTFGPWGTTDCDPVTGKQSRSVSISPGTISVQPKDGWDGQGALCPPPEEQDCPIPCLGDYSEWSICASPVSFFFYFSFSFFLFFF